MEKSNSMHRKVILLGDTTVGKSSIINRRMKNTFNQNIPNTIGTAFFKQSFKREGKNLEMSIWDTCGQEQFMAISTVYYRDAHVILLAIDAKSSESLEMAKVYLDEIENNADPKCTVFLVINKIDLLRKKEYEGEKVGYTDVYSDKVDADATETCKDSCEFFQDIRKMQMENSRIQKIFCVSAKTGENVNNMFNYLVDRFFEFKFALDSLSGSHIDNSKFNQNSNKKKEESKSKGCC